MANLHVPKRLLGVAVEHGGQLPKLCPPLVGQPGRQARLEAQPCIPLPHPEECLRAHSTRISLSSSLIYDRYLEAILTTIGSVGWQWVMRKATRLLLAWSLTCHAAMQSHVDPCRGR